MMGASSCKGGAAQRKKTVKMMSKDDGKMIMKHGNAIGGCEDWWTACSPCRSHSTPSTGNEPAPFCCCVLVAFWLPSDAVGVSVASGSCGESLRTADEEEDDEDETDDADEQDDERREEEEDDDELDADGDNDGGVFGRLSPESDGGLSVDLGSVASTDLAASSGGCSS